MDDNVAYMICFDRLAYRQCYCHRWKQADRRIGNRLYRCRNLFSILLVVIHCDIHALLLIIIIQHWKLWAGWNVRCADKYERSKLYASRLGLSWLVWRITRLRQVSQARELDNIPGNDDIIFFISIGFFLVGNYVFLKTQSRLQFNSKTSSKKYLFTF